MTIRRARGDVSVCTFGMSPPKFHIRLVSKIDKGAWSGHVWLRVPFVRRAAFLDDLAPHEADFVSRHEGSSE